MYVFSIPSMYNSEENLFVEITQLHIINKQTACFDPLPIEDSNKHFFIHFFLSPFFPFSLRCVSHLEWAVVWRFCCRRCSTPRIIEWTKRAQCKFSWRDLILLNNDYSIHHANGDNYYRRQIGYFEYLDWVLGMCLCRRQLHSAPIRTRKWYIGCDWEWRHVVVSTIK